MVSLQVFVFICRVNGFSLSNYHIIELSNWRIYITILTLNQTDYFPEVKTKIADPPSSI